MRLRKTPHKLSPYGSIVVLTPERLATSWVEALPELAQMPTAPSLPSPSPDRPFALFFLSPTGKFHSFFSLWGSSRGILVVFVGRDPQMCIHVWALWLLCEIPAALGPPGT